MWRVWGRGGGAQGSGGETWGKETTIKVPTLVLLWDHRCICCPSSTETLSGAWLTAYTVGCVGAMQCRRSASYYGWESYSQWRTEGGGSVQTPPPEIPKISVESSIAQARRTGVSISICSSLCSHTVVIY